MTTFDHPHHPILPVIVEESTTVGHPDDFRIGGQRATVQGAASDGDCFTGVIWKQKKKKQEREEIKGESKDDQSNI